MSLQAVLCVRNSEKFLLACLQSLVDSGLRPSEIIVVDGKSEDSSWKIAEDFGCTVVSDEGRGFVAARSLGISLVSSDFVLILGPDDSMAHDAVSILTKELRDWTDCACVAARKRVHPDLQGFLDKGMDFYYKNLPSGSVPVVGNPTLYRTELLKSVNYDSRFSSNEDTDWCVRVKALGWDVRRSSNAVSFEIEPLGWKAFFARWKWYGAGDFRFINKYWHVDRALAMKHLFHPLRSYCLNGFWQGVKKGDLNSALFQALCGVLRYQGLLGELLKHILLKDAAKTGR